MSESNTEIKIVKYDDGWAIHYNICESFRCAVFDVRPRSVRRDWGVFLKNGEKAIVVIRRRNKDRIVVNELYLYEAKEDRIEMLLFSLNSTDNAKEIIRNTYWALKERARGIKGWRKVFEFWAWI